MHSNLLQLIFNFSSVFTFCLHEISVLVFLSACCKPSKLNLGSEKSFKDAQSFLEKNLTFICHTFPPMIGIPSKVSWTGGELVLRKPLLRSKAPYLQMN